MKLESLFRYADEMDDRKHELISLARLVTYARNSARDLNAEFSTYCLDLALGSLVEELNKCGVGDLKIADQDDDTPSFISGVSH